jgi:uncharacterized delta-60 repeat protein
LVATALSPSQVHLKWNGTPNTSSYRLEQSSDGISNWVEFTALNNWEYLQSNLPPSTHAYYRVVAVNGNGASPPSAVVDALTPANPWSGSGSLSPTQLAANGSIDTITQLADGRIIVAGNFTTLLGEPRVRIARLLPNYTLDHSFDPGEGPNGSISSVTAMPDGRLYIFGGFNTVAGIARNDIARLNSDGSLDTSFDPGSGGTFVNSIAMQNDGKLLVAGGFNIFFDAGFGGSGQEHLARLNLDGSVDRSFAPKINNDANYAAVQPDGRIVIVGTFSTINGVQKQGLARLMPNGELDPSFSGSAPSGSRISVLSSGKILLSGSFTTVSGIPRKRVAVLNEDGSLDASFVTADGPDSNVSFATEQPDGKILIGGSFTKVGVETRWKIARLNSDGSLDPTFNAEAGPGSGTVSKASSLMDGSILVSGSFTTFGTSSRTYLVRLQGDPITTPPPTLAAPEIEALSSTSVQVSWAHATGTSSWVVERSTNGVDWIHVITLPWTARSYPVTGLDPGTNYFFRVTPRNAAGDGVPSPSATQSTFTGYTQWKLDEGFSATEPETSDHDADDIPLLMEYALGLDPHVAEVDGLPVSQIISDTIALSYRKFRSDVAYSVEASTDLAAWSANGVNQGAGPFPIAWTPRNGAIQKFLRLKVTVAD